MAKATVRRFKCPKCDRTFSMAAHLARHQNTVHAARPKKRATKKIARRRRARRPARTAAKAGRRATVGGPAPLVQQMQAYRAGLVAERSKVAAQIDAIDRALAALGTKARTAPAGVGRGRPGAGPRPGSLKFHVERVLRARGGAMTVKDVTQSVRQSGFKSTNKTLAKSVGIALSQMPNVSRVSRGVFRLK